MTVPQSDNQTHPKQIRHQTNKEEVKGIGGKAKQVNVKSQTFSVNSIYCSTTVNHRLTGPGKMVKLCLLFVGKISNTEI
jgi:hypothetical protein